MHEQLVVTGRRGSGHAAAWHGLTLGLFCSGGAACCR